MKYENYYLDIDKVNALESDERKRIHDYYIDMLHYFSEPNKEKMAISIFHTLNNFDYLKEIRSEKIDQILS